MSSKSSLIKVIFILTLFLWFSGIFYNVLQPSDSSRLFPGLVIHRIYSLVCHQDSTKSFFISNEKLEVCARCTGIYSGCLIFSVIAVLFPEIKPGTKKWLLIGMIPMAADVLFYSTGLYDYSRLTAFITGLILGSVSILYIFASIDDYFLEMKLGFNDR